MSQKTVTPLETFTGYPGGVKTRFERCVPVKVSSDYADLLAAKGLIEKPVEKPKAAKKTSPDEAE